MSEGNSEDLRHPSLHRSAHLCSLLLGTDIFCNTILSPRNWRTEVVGTYKMRLTFDGSRSLSLSYWRTVLFRACLRTRNAMARKRRAFLLMFHAVSSDNCTAF